jgi:hypothetical protein
VEVRLAYLDAPEPVPGHHQDELFHLIERQQPALPFTAVSWYSNASA